jgi:RimJ/RimL family protein N-acetyltransferase
VHAEPIRTSRLDLEPLRVEHAAQITTALADPALHAFIGGAPLSLDENRARFERMLAGSPDPAVSWCNWVIALREADGLTGTVQATISAEGPTAEIAWVVGTPWQGRGIATEAARALVAWLGQRHVAMVVAHIHPEHAASAAVAVAAGLHPTSEWHDGEVRWQRAMTPG